MTNDPSISDYPRPAPALPQVATVYAKDARWGTYAMISAGIGLLQHTAHALGFGLTSEGASQRGALLLVLTYGLRLAGGAGIVSSRRWGFVALLVSSAVHLVLFGPSTLRHGSFVNVLWLAFALWLLVYSSLRLLGIEGPKPIRRRDLRPS